MVGYLNPIFYNPIFYGPPRITGNSGGGYSSAAVSQTINSSGAAGAVVLAFLCSLWFGFDTVLEFMSFLSEAEWCGEAMTCQDIANKIAQQNTTTGTNLRRICLKTILECDTVDIRAKSYLGTTRVDETNK
ncbi:hypothetical protein QBC37DRAFT_402737 [Rhypophila decipiens]|uniref:Uncharacterized protein n=1 Tax=Rhypophila decipiens TaxID=261697 RepID=A0AAN6Y4B6_9PEZI|nr:hypothetical protein QBC37DRAFT_402737 [Rhypophila decipiens]